MDFFFFQITFKKLYRICNYTGEKFKTFSWFWEGESPINCFLELVLSYKTMF